MAFKFRTQRNPVTIPLPSWPALGSGQEPEALMGVVEGMEASAPEERLAKALDEAQIRYIFRYTVGAPRGLPGWKEVDFIVLTKGITYALEVDTAFTHRSKANSDVLHDAIVQNDEYLQASGELWPYVIHADGDSDLSTKDGAKAYVRKQFGKG